MISCLQAQAIPWTEGLCSDGWQVELEGEEGAGTKQTAKEHHWQHLKEMLAYLLLAELSQIHGGKWGKSFLKKELEQDPQINGI